MFGGRIARGLLDAGARTCAGARPREELTGRKPMSVDEWLPRNLAAFR